MNSDASDALRTNLSLIAPGTVLRDGLDRIVHGRTGALIVLGESPELEALCTGGFRIDVPLTAAALRELAKMDGAITLSSDRTRILRAAVHLMPNAGYATRETGTRHRTADRVAQQTGIPTITVSSAMSTIALFVGGASHMVQRPEVLLTRANQAIATLTRYREALREAATHLTSLEVQDLATVRDVTLVAERLEMFGRLADEVEDELIELGSEGKLVRLQLQELTAGVDDLAENIRRDYEPDEEAFPLDAVATPSGDVMQHRPLAAPAGFEAETPVEARVHARGYRQLAHIPRLPAPIAARLVDHFGTLQQMFAASTAELLTIEGVDYQMARIIREGLLRIAESAFPEALD